MDALSSNDILYDMVFTLIFKKLNTHDIKICSLVCHKWLNIINNSKEILRKLLFMINEENIDEIEPETLTRKFNSLEFRSIEFWELSSFHQMIESADQLCLVWLNENETKDILEVCKTPLLEVELIEPRVQHHLHCYNPITPCKRTTKLEIKKCVFKLIVDAVQSWHIIKVFDNLLFKLNAIELKIHAFLNYEQVYPILCHVHQKHGNVLSDFTLAHELGLDGFTKLVDYFINIPDLKLNKFYTRDLSHLLCDAQYFRLLESQTSITEITSKSCVAKPKLLEHVVKLMPHIEKLDLWMCAADLEYLLAHLNVFKQLQHLSLVCDPPQQPFVLDFLKDLRYLESFSIKTENKCELKLPTFERAFWNLKKLEIIQMTVTDETMQEIIRSMPSLEILDLKATEKMTADGLTGNTTAPYSIENLKMLKQLRFDGTLFTKCVLNKMNLPFLKFVHLYFKNYARMKVNKKQLCVLEQQCPKLCEFRSDSRGLLWKRQVLKNK